MIIASVQKLGQTYGGRTIFSGLSWEIHEKARIGLMDLIRGTAFNKRIALPAKTPVELTLDTSLNFDELLAAWQNAYKAQSATATRSAPVQP